MACHMLGINTDLKTLMVKKTVNSVGVTTRTNTIGDSKWLTIDTTDLSDRLTDHMVDTGDLLGVHTDLMETDFLQLTEDTTQGELIADGRP